MEAMVWDLADKLEVIVQPRDTWGTTIKNMEPAIRKLPESTDAEMQKKERWSACNINLYHVKTAWRDPSMHATRNYDEKEAADIIGKVQLFAEQLADL
jgi:hypothetical protein